MRSRNRGPETTAQPRSEQEGEDDEDQEHDEEDLRQARRDARDPSEPEQRRDERDDGEGDDGFKHERQSCGDGMRAYDEAPWCEGAS